MLFGKWVNMFCHKLRGFKRAENGIEKEEYLCIF
jgi:hypothetical protein